MVPWVTAGAAVVVTLLVVGTRFVGSGPAASPAGGQAATSPGSAPPAGGVPDITNMTLRERADRLFERIMIASEAGDTSQVGFFSPMALQSYEMLGELDADARYHLALIHVASGDGDAAGVQGDSIRVLDRDHLFATLIDATVAGLDGSDGARRDAYQRFLDTYDTEVAKARPEYLDHQSALDAFRREAQEALGRSAGNG